MIEEVQNKIMDFSSLKILIYAIPAIALVSFLLFLVLKILKLQSNWLILLLIAIIFYFGIGGLVLFSLGQLNLVLLFVWPVFFFL